MADDPHALRPGASIAGYNIIRVLGAGGFGITYEADSPFTGKRVAIKEFFPRGIASREDGTRIVYSARDMEVVDWALKRFESSTLDQCKLRHTNIVDVIHYVKDNGTGYMIMEYVEGETLEHWLREREFLPTAEELQPLLSPVLSALEYLHARNMIHRDIAPDNIMMREDGVPMIIDFGAIKLIGQETQLRSDVRSYAVMKQFYSPPEQVEDGGELDHRADIYSVGAVLYRAFSGLPPASAEERMQRRAFGKADSYEPLAAHATHVPHAMTQAIDRALSFHAADRQSDIAELRDELNWGGISPPPTFALPRNRDVGTQPRRSTLPWLLPLIGIAAIAGVAAYLNGLIALPMPGTEVVKVPDSAPKLDDIKEIPQKQIHTQGDGEQKNADPQSPSAYAARYAGDVSVYRMVENNVGEPLTNCVPGRRTALTVEVNSAMLHISHGGNTYVAELKTDGSFDYETGALLSRKMRYSGRITPEAIEGEFVGTTDRGSCYGKITAKASQAAQ
jgi:serine/threonine protein kinase